MTQRRLGGKSTVSLARAVDVSASSVWELGEGHAEGITDRLVSGGNNIRPDPGRLRPCGQESAGQAAAGLRRPHADLYRSQRAGRMRAELPGMDRRAGAD